MLDGKCRPGFRLLPKPMFVEGRDEKNNVAVEVAMTYNTSYTNIFIPTSTISTPLKAVHTFPVSAGR
jgi:hypothetical protein